MEKPPNLKKPVQIEQGYNGSVQQSWHNSIIRQLLPNMNPPTNLPEGSMQEDGKSPQSHLVKNGQKQVSIL
jgi:hypothetical protein